MGIASSYLQGEANKEPSPSDQNVSEVPSKGQHLQVAETLGSRPSIVPVSGRPSMVPSTGPRVSVAQFSEGYTEGEPRSRFYKFKQDFINSLNSVFRGSSVANILLFGELYCTFLHGFSRRIVKRSEEYNNYVSNVESVINFDLDYLVPFLLAPIMAYIGDSHVRRRQMFLISMGFLVYSVLMSAGIVFVSGVLQTVLILSSHYSNKVYISMIGIKDSVILEQVGIVPDGRTKLRTYVVVLVIFKELGRITDNDFLSKYLSEIHMAQLLGSCGLILLGYVVLLFLYKKKIQCRPAHIKILETTFKCIFLAIKEKLMAIKNKRNSNQNWISYAPPYFNDYITSSSKRFVEVLLAISSIIPFVISYAGIYSISIKQKKTISHYYESGIAENLPLIYASSVYYVFTGFIFLPIIRKITPIKTHLRQSMISFVFLIISLMRTGDMENNLRNYIEGFPEKGSAHVVLYSGIETDAFVTLYSDNRTTFSQLMLPYTRVEMKRIVQKTESLVIKASYNSEHFTLIIPFVDNKALAVVIESNGLAYHGYEALGEDLKIDNKSHCLIYVITCWKTPLQIEQMDLINFKIIPLTILPEQLAPSFNLSEQMIHSWPTGNTSFGYMARIGGHMLPIILVSEQLVKGRIYSMYVFARNDSPNILIHLVYNIWTHHVFEIYPQIILMIMGLSIMDITMYHFLSLETPLDLKSSCFILYVTLRNPTMEILENSQMAVRQAEKIGESSNAILLFFFANGVLCVYSFVIVYFVKNNLQYNYPDHA